MPNYKQISLRFNMDKPEDRELYENLNNPIINKNSFIKQAVIEQINNSPLYSNNTSSPLFKNETMQEQTEEEKKKTNEKKRLPKDLGFQAK